MRLRIALLAILQGSWLILISPKEFLMKSWLNVKGFPFMLKFNMNGFLITVTIMLQSVIPLENAHKGEASDIVKHPIPQEAGQHEVEKTDAIVQPSGGSKIIVDEDPLIIDIIRSRELATTIHVWDAIKFVEETSSISIETFPVHVVQVEDTLALAKTHNGNQHSNSFADMRITGPWCDAVTDMDYGNDHTLDNFEQELGTNNYVVGTDLNLSNFSANVIHDMQVLGVVPSVAQQTKDFLSDSWANMG
jgi:hypothetical protein